jgi:hypothetical protein
VGVFFSGSSGSGGGGGGGCGCAGSDGKEARLGRASITSAISRQERRRQLQGRADETPSVLPSAGPRLVSHWLPKSLDC